MRKYLVDLLGREKRILLTEDKIEKGICFEGYDVIYLIKDTVKNVKEYVNLLEKKREEDFYYDYYLNNILESNNVEFIYLSEFITDEDIEEYINEGYKSIYVSGENTVEDIKELYSYNQEEYYIKNEYGKNEYYQIGGKEEVEYWKQLESNIHGRTLLYKNIDCENRYVYISNYQNTEIQEMEDWEVEN